MSQAKLDDDALQRVADIVTDRLGAKLDKALASIEEIKHQVAKLPTIHDDTGELKSNMRAVKQALTETNRDLRDAEERVHYIENAFYNAQNASLNLFNNESKDILLER